MQRTNIIELKPNKKQKKILQECMAYWAGFFDGEGTIGVWSSAPKKNYNYNRLLIIIRAVSTDEFILKEFVSEMSNDKVCKVKKTKSRGDNQRDYFQVSWGSKKGIDILKKLLPYLRIKKERAKLAIALHNLILQQKVNKDIGKRGFQSLTQSQLSERQEYVAKIKKLNLRGKKTSLLGGDCYAIVS